MAVRFLRFASREEWLAYREAEPLGVGGSRLAELIGVGFKGPPTPRAGRRGLIAEQYAIERAADLLGCGLPERDVCFEDVAEPRDRGTLDAVLWEQAEVWEVKTIGLGWRRAWRDEIPLAQRAQAEWYAGHTGMPVRFILLFLADYEPEDPRAAALAAALDVDRVVRPDRDTFKAYKKLAAAWRQRKERGLDFIPAPVAEPLGLGVREGTDEEALLLARFAEAKAAAEKLPTLREEIRTCARGSAGIRAGGRTVLVNRRGSVRLLGDDNE